MDHNTFHNSGSRKSLEVFILQRSIYKSTWCAIQSQDFMFTSMETPKLLVFFRRFIHARPTPLFKFGFPDGFELRKHQIRTQREQLCQQWSQTWKILDLMYA